MVFLIQGVINYNFYDYEDEKDERTYALETIISNGISFFLIVCQIGFWFYYYCFNKNNAIKIIRMNEGLSQDKLNESQEN